MKPLKERDGDLVNHWYILALENEVPTGEPIRRTLYDTPYVIFRSAEGIAVLHDKCLHRGAKLSLGKVAQGRLQCPYHGWSYNHRGEVCEIPSDGPGASAPKWCSTKVPTFLQDGCIWIWPGEAGLATAGPEWKFPHFKNRQVTQYFMTTDFDNEVTHLVQNFMDVPHTVFVHSKWFRNRALLKVPAKVEVGSSKVKVTYLQPNDSIGFTERILNPAGDLMEHTDEFIFPNLTRVDYNFGKRFFIINSQCSPISSFKTRVYTWIAYDIGKLSAMMSPFIQFYTRQVIEQDVRIMKNQGDNLKELGETEFKSTQADEHHLAIDRMRANGVKDRHSPATLNFVREREFWI